MEEHKEPWSIWVGIDHHSICDAGGKEIIDLSHAPPVDWERVVACVNACRGVTTEELAKIAAWKDTIKDSAGAAAADMLDDLGWTLYEPDGSKY